MNEDPAAARRLLQAQAYSNLAQWIDIFLMFSVPAFVWKATPADIALVAAAYGLPVLFLGPVIGGLLDRGPPLRWMLWGTLLRTTASLCMVWAPQLDAFTWLVAAKGLAKLFHGPSGAIVTKRLVAPGGQLRYFALLGTLDHGCKLVTPLVVACLVTWVSPQTVFLLSAGATAACWFRLRALSRYPALMPAAGAPRRRAAPQWPPLPPALLQSALLSVGIALALAVYDPHLPGYLHAQGFGTAVFSQLVAATALGAIGATLLVRFRWADAVPATLMRQGAAAFCIALGAVALLATLAPGRAGAGSLSLLWCASGFGYELFAVGAAVTLQRLCPPAFLGRVSTYLRSLQSCAGVAGPLLGAGLISRYGGAAPFIASACGLMALLGAVQLWCSTRPRAV